jgi:GNAT superfamily N-acetyltransferase
MIEIRQVRGADRHNIEALAAVLFDCVAGGASVNFMDGFSQRDAEAFFARVFDSLERNERILLAAFDQGRLVGTVQVLTAMPPNQPHRAEIAKLLVHRSARGQGIAGLLMQSAEDAARAAGKTLLVLDTASAEAERVYTRLGWTRLGTIPNFALLPNGEPCATTFFYKQL